MQSFFFSTSAKKEKRKTSKALQYETALGLPIFVNFSATFFVGCRNTSSNCEFDTVFVCFCFASFVDSLDGFEARVGKYPQVGKTKTTFFFYYAGVFSRLTLTAILIGSKKRGEES